jgi:hypothetical protein
MADEIFIQQSIAEGSRVAGFVYLLVSRNCEFIKIGGTEFPPTKRVREINASVNYSAMGPWRLEDFREVSDWRKTESHLHFKFGAHRETQTRELFRIAPATVSQALQNLDPENILKRPVIDRMLQDTEFAKYIVKLFRFSGLLHFFEIQGAWTFSIFT